MSWLNRRRKNKSEIDADIESYLAEKTDALVEAGLTRDEAQFRARREFGNVTHIKELSSDEWTWAVVEGISRDARYAIRSLLRNPVFALTAVFTLALGIGANTAIFSLLRAVVLRSLPVPNAEQLRLLSVTRNAGPSESIFSFPVMQEMQADTAGQASVAGFSSITPMKVGGQGGISDQADAQLVSTNFFDVLGVKPALGRLLSPADDNLASAYRAVISAAYWSKHFAEDPTVVGRTLMLNNTPVTIVGVAGREFFGLKPGSRPDFWIPLTAQFDVRYNRNAWNSNGDGAKPWPPQRQIRWISIVTRIPDKGKEARVASILNRIHAGDMRRETQGRGDADPLEVRDLLQSKVQLDSGEKGLGDLRKEFSEPLLALMCAAGLVLLIASVNLASLALARVIGRRKEIAVRCSIGATRGRIISQFLTEVLLLSLIGGLIAIPVALGASQVLVRWASSSDPMPLEIHMDGAMLLFVVGASLLAGIVFGLLPALEAINFPLADAMKSHASAAKAMRLPWGRTLIVIQITFSFVLLAGAVLFVRTFMNYAKVPLGYQPEHVLSITVDPRGARYQLDKLTPIYHSILEAVGQVPGVQSASFATCGLARGCQSISDFTIEGRPQGKVDMQNNSVSPEYFATVGLRLVSGRLFTYQDAPSAPQYAVINSEAAKRFYTGLNPVGRHLNKVEIVGVLANARVNDIHEEAKPMAYFSLEQSPDFARAMEVRVQGDPQQLEQAIRRSIYQTAPTFPVMSVRLLTDVVASNLLRERLVARLAMGFAILAVGLACLGVYGVLSYAISRRTSELGIRLALGAEAGGVRRMVLWEALSVILIGLGCGVPVALGLTRVVRGLLYGVSAQDPSSLMLCVAAILAIGFLAAYVPAWRASKVDPSVALRHE